MIKGISKKLIFISLLFINFLQPSKSGEVQKINRKENNESSKLIWSEISNSFTSSTSSDLSFNNFRKFPLKKTNVKKSLDIFLAEIQEKSKEIIIQSDEQSEINDVIYAEGSVTVDYKGKTLNADNLIYDKSTKKISASGNVSLIINDQVIQASRFEYSLISKKGYLLDVKGSINFSTLMDDLSSNFNSSDFKKVENLIEFKKKEVLNTPGIVENWLFVTDKLTIDGDKFKTKKAILSNDLLEFKQLKIIINSLKVTSEADKLRFKSSLSYLILDETIPIPFWFRALIKPGEIFKNNSGLNLGYESLDKDGYFIGRKFNSIDIFGDFVLDLEPQFLIQRSLKGYTESFVEKNESITSNRVKRNTSFEDYFALKSQIKGKINNWNLEIDKNLNSLDINKFPNAFRLKTKLSKEIDFLGSKWEKIFYGTYRERFWNGSLGEAEIYSGYGSKLQKQNSWNVNGIQKTEILSLGLADITAEALNTKDLKTKLKGNLFYALDQKFPISIVKPENKSIDVSYKYIPEPFTKGLSLNSRIEASYSFYENGYHQEYLGFGIGPELILGNFKNKTFDYSRLSLFPFYRFNSGESVFKFDQNNDNFTLKIAFDQQLFGPVLLKSTGTLNLSNDSDNYGQFISSKISINWKRRSYEVGIFYQPHNQAGGISYKLFGFK